MTLEIAIVLGLLVCATVLFTVERLPVDLVALVVAGLLMLTGVLTPAEGLSGFSHPATATVAAMFVLSAAVSKTALIRALGLRLTHLLRRNAALALVGMMAVVGVISAFVNNTATVALLIPVVLKVCRDTNTPPSRLLMPLSFASLLGGMCTLIGTSTNILVSSLAREHGMQPFGMFEFAPLGLVLYLAGIAYMATLGVRWLGKKAPESDLAESFDLGEYVTEVLLLPDSQSVGKRLDQAPLVKRLDLDVLEIHRDGQAIQLPEAPIILQSHDVLRIRCNVDDLRGLERREGVALLPQRDWSQRVFESRDALLVEAVVAPNSRLVGITLRESTFEDDYVGVVLAIRHHGGIKHARLFDQKLVAGDALLIKIARRDLERLKNDPGFVVVSELAHVRRGRGNTFKALTIMALVVSTAASGALPIVVSALAGCVLMVLAGCIKLEEAYRAVEWRVIFLLGGILPLGLALEKTGAAALVAGGLLGVVGQYGPLAVLAALYLVTSLLTAVMSNNATAALLTPIAFQVASATGIDPRPLLVAVTFASSTAFMTPMGYQTNLMIYGAGKYRFEDFLRVGTPLNLLAWALAVFLIPRIWPF